MVFSALGNTDLLNLLRLLCCPLLFTFLVFLFYLWWQFITSTLRLAEEAEARTFRIQETSLELYDNLLYSASASKLQDSDTTMSRAPFETADSWNKVPCEQCGHDNMDFHYEALQFFQKMQICGVRPDGITLVEVLSACSHSGLVDEGCLYFVSLSHEHGIKPTTEHYGCMIDLFGRIGQLSLANELVNNMPFHPDIIAWRALLSACRIYGDIERAQCAVERILELDPPTSDSVCILLCRGQME